LAIPPPALSGSGSRVETYQFSSQPGNTRLPVRIFCKSITSICFFIKLSSPLWK